MLRFYASPIREIGFGSVVRASGRGLPVWARETQLSQRWWLQHKVWLLRPYSFPSRMELAFFYCVYQSDTITVVICMDLCELHLRDGVFCMGVLHGSYCCVLIFGCVLHRFYWFSYCFVGISLCVAWVLPFCWYFNVYWIVFIGLLVFQCVLHWFYRVVGIWLCITWVLLCCWYLILYCMGFIVLLVFDCVFHMFYRFVCIGMGFIVLLIFDFVLHGFYGFVCISWCIA